MTEKFDNDKTSTNEYNLEKLINEIEAKQLEFVVETKEHEINSLLEENKTLLLENKNLFNVLKDKDKQIQELCKKLKEERDQNTILLNMALANNKDDESHSVNNFNLNLENKQLAPGIQKIIQIQKIIDEQEKEIQKLQDKTLQQISEIKKRRNF
ncbi:hypothetical protein ACJA29_01835 [Metamycoplasma sualvi]|uniref:hypothetical protein n=1 Tax=Metamycoplasma sualvi TaxID=2125 RepID=UPI00387368DD